MTKRILQIGNWPPPVCGWAMSLVGLRNELVARGWDCPVMNLNENRRVRTPECIDVQNGWDYLRKVLQHVRRGYGVHVRVNGESKKGYLLALAALVLARLARRPALLTYCGGHQQSYFPAPKASFRYLAFSFLFRMATRVYCNSEAVKSALLSTRVDSRLLVAIPHISPHYLQFSPAALPAAVDDFCHRHEGVFFVYICYRKEYMLEFFAEAVRRFRARFPEIGFLLVGSNAREVGLIAKCFQNRNLAHAVCITGSVPHDLFLTLLNLSIAYIRLPLTDGVCSSVLESLTLKTPVLASDNGTRPLGVELWDPRDHDSLLKLMTAAVGHREVMVARIPPVTIEDNTCKLADDIEAVFLGGGQQVPGALGTSKSAAPEFVRHRGRD